MAKDINWQAKYKDLVNYIAREHENASKRATVAFRSWEYNIDGRSHEELALFDAIERELHAILSFSEGLCCDFDEEECQ